jgi:hypothetical protein
MLTNTLTKLIKFRTFSHHDRTFSYSGGGGDLQQFIGILDKNLKQIYERDVVKGIYGLEGIEVIGEVWYNNDSCAYHVGDYGIYNIELESLEIIGNMDQDFIYNEQGELEKKYE